MLYLKFFNLLIGHLNNINMFNSNKFHIEKSNYYLFYLLFLNNVINHFDNIESIFNLINRNIYIFIFLELLAKKNKFYKYNSMFLKKNVKEQIPLLDKFNIRINAVHFFILGNYIEYIRIFFFNYKLKFSNNKILRRNYFSSFNDFADLTKSYTLNTLFHNKFIIYYDILLNKNVANIYNTKIYFDFYLYIVSLLKTKYISFNFAFLISFFRQ